MEKRPFLFASFPGLWLAPAVAFAAEQPVAHPKFSAEQVEFYEKTVQPILAENCYSCHGGATPDAAGHVKIKSGFQVISRLGVLKGGEHGPAFNEKAPAESLLLRVTSYDDDHLKMPPRGKLQPDELSALKHWVDMGLPVSAAHENKLVVPHDDSGPKKSGPDNTWTYLPRQQVTPPAPAPGARVFNPIDQFLAAKQSASGLKAAPPAPPEALIRRCYYDLTGLPPSPEETARFVAQWNQTAETERPALVSKLVDQLLASPHYGEKYARHWLDLVRYAETNGFERDGFKPQIWRYRQWVIDSMNADKPFDQFAREQLAGDELEDKTPDSLVATGYWRLMQWDDEPADPKQHAYDVMDDNVRVTSEVFLGATMGCARCHNHKVDPITQKDYYSFMAFLHGITPYSLEGAVRNVNDPGAVLTRGPRGNGGGRAQRIAELQSQLVSFQKNARERFEKKGVATPANTGRTLVKDSRKDPQKWWYTTTQPARRWPDPGYTPESTPGWKEADAGFGTETTPGAVMRTSWSTPEIWLRTSFQLTEIPDALNLTIHHDEDAEIYLNGKMVKQLRSFRTRYITLPLGADAIPALQTGKNILAIHVIQTSGDQFIDAGLEVGDSEIATLLEERGQEVCNADELKEYQQIKRRLGFLQNGREREPDPGAVLAQIVSENGSKAPDIFLHVRGNPHVPGEQCDPAFPAVFKAPQPDIKPLERSSGRRRALAEWIASPDNPRTARVMVNRLWQWHFGRGLVATSNDFGKLGSGCTHPELLDWLAGQLIENKWSLKQMHRLIMSSAAYQESSIADEAIQRVAAEKDPVNNLLFHFEPRRLASEELRDSILAVSGNINLAYGGESFFPPMPDEVIATASMGRRSWGTSPPDQEVRRSVYMKSKRSLSHPLMTDFDQADTDSSCPVRFATTVPNQSLNLLNSKFLNQQAAVFADRLRKEAGGNLAAQIKRGIALATQRPAKDGEVKILAQLAADLRARHGASEKDALQRICLVLLNLNEFVFVD